MINPRIVSFLPAATEMIFALGLGEQLVGVSHECDFPPAAKQKPVVVRPKVDFGSLTPGEIDRQVSQSLQGHESLYVVDEGLLQSLQPDLIVTQDLCQVCAPSGNELTYVLRSLPNKPRLLSLSAQSLQDIFENIRELGAITHRIGEAVALIAECRNRLNAVAWRCRRLPRPKVFCCEWVDPIYCSGHWIPELVEIAGGCEPLGRKCGKSVRIEWQDVMRLAPDVLILMPCGFDAAKSAEQARELAKRPGWCELPAVKTGRVFAVDANAYFVRPGPRVVDGAELLAHFMHPDVCDAPLHVGFHRVC